MAHEFLTGKARRVYSLVVLAGVLCGALSAGAQTPGQGAARTINAGLSIHVDEPAETFRRFHRGVDDGVFLLLLERMVGKEAGDAEEALEAQAVNFYETFAAATKDDYAKVEDKAKEQAEKRYAEMRRATTAARPAASGATRRGGPRVEDGDDSSDFEPESPEPKDSFAGVRTTRTPAAEDGAEVRTVEKDSSITASANDSKSIDLAGATITRTSSANANQNFDGKAMTVGLEQTEKIEAVSKTSHQKIDKTDKLSWSVSLDVCPDAGGVVRGRGKATIYTQTASNLVTDVAALTRELNIEFTVTAYVNDDAELTHYDMKGESAETLTGYDRAGSHGLTQSADGWSDGTRRIGYDITDSKPPRQVPSPYGGKEKVDSVFGAVKATTFDTLSEAQAKRINEAADAGLGIIRGELDLQILSLMSRMANGECVDVECSAPKAALKPNESVEVTTVSRSKQDLSRFNARIEAIGSDIAPRKQMGTPTAVFTFTAQSGGGGVFTVQSVSRRGIGLGVLEFAKEEEPEACDGNWHGTIEIRTVFEDVRKETIKPGDLASNLQMSGYKETIHRSKYEGAVKLVGPKLNTASVSLLRATYSASGDRYYLDHGFTNEPGECGWYRKTTTKVDGGLEETEKTSGEGDTDVTVQFDGGGYRISAGIPEIPGTYLRRAWYHPTGYCQEKNNQPKDDTSDGKTTFDRQSYSLEGRLDPRQPDVLTGTKIIKSDDGKEETIITWHLTRCAPMKKSPGPSAKKK
jgi:hypothetical protein